MRFLLLGLVLVTGFLEASPCSEEQKIDFLIREVEGLDGTFVRNGEEHKPKEAAEHLRMKLAQAQKSWFAPPKSEWTAALFIEKLASRSSWSGKPYLIRLRGKPEISAEVWLRERVKFCTPDDKVGSRPIEGVK